MTAEFEARPYAEPELEAVAAEPELEARPYADATFEAIAVDVTMEQLA